MPIRRRKNTERTTAEPSRPKQNTSQPGVSTSSPKPLSETALNEKVEGSDLTLKEILSTPWLRITHLYFTKDKFGIKTKFDPWPEQEELFWDMHYLNIVLKARQRGITTMIQIFMLDACLFNEDINAGVIAHNREDAQKFFDDKIKYAYDNLPQAIKNAIPARSDNSNELSFSNGSSIRVGTSMRSGTLQYLHISEYGKICAKYPEKAQEIRSGSLNTVAPGNFVFIESTAEGAHGDFYEKSTRAERLQLDGEPLTKLDYKFFFFPWWRAEEYTLTDRVEYQPADEEYFMELRDEGIELRDEQKNWYVKKKAEQGDHMMTQEYPSTAEEAFRGIIDGAVFGKQLRAARKEQRITNVPHITSLPVNTFWDIGRDMTSIWFHQRVGPSNHFINFYQELNQSLAYFAHLLLQDLNHPFHQYTYGEHYFPHDMGQVDYSQSDQKTREEVARDLGLRPSVIVPRVQIIEEGLEMTRQAFANCYFDKTNCDEGIKGLENYRYEFNEKLEVYTPKPLHNWASHPSDAFRQFAQGYRFRPYSNPEDADNPLSRVYRRRTRNNQSDWRV